MNLKTSKRESSFNRVETAIRRFLSVALLIPILAYALPAEAADKKDNWLPGAGHASVAVATGVPFLVMSELSLGVTDHGAIGILGGTTPIVSGFGVRPRVAFELEPSLRLLAAVPVVYYPPHDDGPAWWLTRPSVMVETAVSSRVGLAFGGGVVAVQTHDALFGSESGSAAPQSTYGRRLRSDDQRIWWTLNVVSSVWVSDHSYLFADVTGVFRDYRPAGKEWIGGPPVIVFLGVGSQI